MGIMLFVPAATSVFFGLIPALEASKVDICSWLSEGAEDKRATRIMDEAEAVSFEVVLGVILVTTAGLLARPFATFACR